MKGQSFVIHGNLKGKEKSRELSKISIVLICFAIVCLISSWVINWNRGSIGRVQLPPEGGMVGPITVTKDRTVYQISVSQDIRQDNSWSFVTGEVLDKNKEYLFSFGKEFWKESGYDSDGRWSEKETKYDMKVTLEKGTYYLNFESQKSREGGAQNSIWVIVKQKGGSALPFFVSGIIALIIGVILNEIANRTMTKIISDLAEAADD